MAATTAITPVVIHPMETSLIQLEILPVSTPPVTPTCLLAMVLQETIHPMEMPPIQLEILLIMVIGITITENALT